ncbi:hypothetical protein GGR51DRAFT_391907 [Nemania sp. FL0031]|nr:hypothetical protein GGR51DRAFT_391907 [Nemania sp. FL0031]
MSTILEGQQANGEGNDGWDDLIRLGSELWRFDHSSRLPLREYGSPSERLNFDELLEACSMPEWDFNTPFQPTLDYFTVEGFTALPPQYPFSVGDLSSFLPPVATPPTRADEFPPPGSSPATSCPIDTSLPAPKTTWTIEQEEYLLAAKKNRCSFKAISEAMNERFGVERNPNVLSKKYRAIRDRNIEESIFDQAFKNSLPSMLEVIDEEVQRLDPDGLDKQKYSEIRQELHRKLPGFQYYVLVA